MMKLAAITVLLCACCASPDVRSQLQPLFDSTDPPTLSTVGCVVGSDMLLVARALAARGVQRAEADEITALIYEPWVGVHANDALRMQLTNIAYRSVKRPITLSMAFLVQCRALRAQWREG